MLWQIKNKLAIASNIKLNFVQSELKSHPLLVILYIYLLQTEIPQKQSYTFPIVQCALIAK